MRHVLAFAVLSVSIAGCLAPSESPGPDNTPVPAQYAHIDDADSCQPIGPVTADAKEETGEAAQPWTRADCQNTFVTNYRKCEPWPPNVKAVCYAMVATALVACIAGAEG